MNHIDGRNVTDGLEISCEIAVVGSGPAGATVAWELARNGFDIVVVEEGRWVRPADFPEDGFTAMTELYREMGASVTRGRAPMPYLQGVAVGGTSVINGAISWRLPRDVWESWVATDPALANAVSFEEVERALDDVEARVGIAETPLAVQGRNDRLLARGAGELGLEHRPIRRNVVGCRGSGRCLQGCGNGAKRSADLTYLTWAMEAGARLVSSTRVERVVTQGGRGVGVSGTTGGGARIDVRASEGVVVAASAIQTPLLLLDSGLGNGQVGRGFQAHPGVSVSGRFAEPIRVWEGSTQGHEVTGLRDQGLKFEALGFDLSVAATRMKRVGRELLDEAHEMEHLAHWGCAVKAGARGRVRRGFLGDTIVDYSLTEDDMRKVRRGVAWLGRMMLAAGAEWVDPGVWGFESRVTDASEFDRFEAEGPVDPRSYAFVTTHMFGTCRMGSNPASSAVDLDFALRGTDRVWVADSSVFPSNTGVNPQTSIIAIASLCGQRIAHRIGTAHSTSQPYPLAMRTTSVIP